MDFVTAACLAGRGLDVTSVDVDGNKVEIINHCQSPIIKPGLANNHQGE
jgi:UDP-glucose 6-dehydrogenase